MADTSFDHGVQFGGSGDFQVRHGGNSRPSFPVASGTTFREGMCTEITVDGEVQRSTSQQTRMTGIVGTRRDPVGDMGNDQTIGSGQAMMVFDPAVVETIQLSSGTNGIFAINDDVYNDGNGKWASVVISDTRVYGSAMNAASSADGDILEMNYYGVQRPVSGIVP
jgi:hypothetical protein